MAAQVKIANVQSVSQGILVTGFIVLSGNYPTGGDPLNFATALQDPTFIGLLPAVESASALNADAWSMNGSGINGSSSTNYGIVSVSTGTPAMINPATGIKLKCAALSATPSTEHSAGAYEAQYTGDIIAFQALFTKML
jgi:hypothetical protein